MSIVHQIGSVILKAGTAVIGKVRLVTATGDEITNDTLDTVQVSQATHDNLNLNSNLQVANADVANGNPVPVSDAGGTLTVDQATHDNFNANANIQVANADASVANPVPVAPGTGATWDVSDRAARDLGKVDVALLDQYTPTDVDSGAGTDNALPVALRMPAAGGGVTAPGDAANGLDVDVTRVGGNVTVVQATHDSLNANANLQVTNTDVSASNPVPVEGPDISGAPVTGNPVLVAGQHNPGAGNVVVPALTEVDGKLAVSLYGKQAAEGDTALLVDASGHAQVDILSATIANLDIALSALRDAITAAAPNAKTLNDLYTKLAGGLPAALGAGGGLKVEGIAGGVATPVSIADGADVAEGALADAIVAAGAAGSLSAKLRRVTQGLEDLKTLIVLAAGTAVIGKVRLVTTLGDEVTDDTADAVKVSQATHDNLQANANLQVGNADVGAGNPVPVSDNAGALSIDIGGVAPQLDNTDEIAVSLYGKNAAAGDTPLLVDAAGHAQVDVLTAPTTAVTVADGSDVTLGAVADAVVAAGAAGSISAKLRRVTQGLEDLKSLIVLAAGTAIIGKVGIDQTTPGTTNRVDVGAALPAGTNTVGKVYPYECTSVSQDSAANTAQNIDVAAVGAQSHYVTAIEVAISGASAGADITVQLIDDQDGVPLTKWKQIIGSGAARGDRVGITFPYPRKMTVNTKTRLAVSAGGASVVTTANLAYYTV